MVKIFVGGFPLEMTELELVQIVSMHGNVSTIKIVRDKKTGICKGYAFLEMKNRAEAENVVEALHGRPMADRKLTVKINEEETAPPVAVKQKKAPVFNPVYVKVERPSGIVKKKRQRKQL